MTEDYTTLAEAFDALKRRDPLLRAEQEDFSDAGELPDISAQGIEHEAAQMVALADRIRDAEYPGDTFDERLDMELAEGWLRADAMMLTGEIDGSPRHAVLPTQLAHLAGLTLSYIGRDPRGADAVIADAISRMEQLPAFLDQNIARLDRPVAPWLELEVDTAKEFAACTAAVRAYAQEKGYHRMTDLDAVLERAEAAVSRYDAQLAAMPTRTEMSMGEDATAKLFGYRGVVDSLDAIHAGSQDQLREMLAFLDQSRGELIRKHGLDPELDNAGVAIALNEKFAIPSDEVVDHARALLARTREFAYERGLVRPLGDVDSEIIWTPEYMRSLIPIAAMLPPGALATGRRVSTFLVTPGDTVGVNLSRLTLPSTVSHELEPGHGYQVPRAYAHPSLVRRWTWAMDLAEGWTTRVAEEVMTDQGFFGDPELALEERFAAYSAGLRLPARVCFTLACLTGDDRFLENHLGYQPQGDTVFDRSVDLYAALTPFTPDRARSDVVMFSAEGTYAAMYSHGNRRFHAVEKAAAARQGEAFSLPQLYEAMLSMGNLPMSYVQRSLEQQGLI